MKITWLGQAGFLIESNNATVIVDPYLSNSVEKINSQNYRRQPIDEKMLEIRPDILVFTHNHLDHFDPETADVYLSMDNDMTVLAPTSVWTEARKRGNGTGGFKNHVCFDRESEWTERGLRFTAVHAEHSDAYAIGVIITELATDKKYYITGDTLYNNKIFKMLPEDIYAVFLPINGVGNNMNAADAARFAARVGAKIAVPVHFGLFDGMSGEEFELCNRVIPKIYEEIEL